MTQVLGSRPGTLWVVLLWYWISSLERWWRWKHGPCSPTGRLGRCADTPAWAVAHLPVALAAALHRRRPGRRRATHPLAAGDLYQRRDSAYRYRTALHPPIRQR